MPKINNDVFQFADLELALADATDGAPLAISNAFSELNYSDKVDREKQRGASRRNDGSTDGEYDCEGDVTLFRKMFDYVSDWCKERGVGFYDATFNLTVNYRKKGEAMRTDTIKGVKFASRDAGHSQGPSPLAIKCDLFIDGAIFWNGVGPFGETL